MVDWKEARTPLGLPGQRQAICTRTSFVALREGVPEKASEHNFYATSLPPSRADLDRMKQLIRGHWQIENCLHHAKDRTWLEDRHWVGNRVTGAIVTMLRSVACCLVKTAKIKGIDPEAYCPERVEHCDRFPRSAINLVTGKIRL